VVQPDRPPSNPKSINDIKTYKRAIRPLLEEYFVSGDIEELRQYVLVAMQGIAYRSVVTWLVV
jgi:hypothetical protein